MNTQIMKIYMHAGTACMQSVNIIRSWSKRKY